MQEATDSACRERQATLDAKYSRVLSQLMGDPLLKKPGDRVFAMESANNVEVRLFGCGIYEGDFVPVEAVGFFADCAKELGHTNPRIRLDSGKIVYGCECWWGLESVMEKTVAGRSIVPVDIDEARAKASEHEPRIEKDG